MRHIPFVMKIFLRSLIALMAFFAYVAQGGAQQAVTFDTDSLSIVTSGGVQHDFTIELAANPQQRSRGLMFRESLAPDAGMLFDYNRPRRVRMWMKNTLIPLDMLFIQSDGVVESIRERAVPHSLDTIGSKGKVRAVLELPGGTVDRLGLAPGDRVLHEIFQ